mgnify:CR=1 FL=1
MGLILFLRFAANGKVKVSKKIDFNSIFFVANEVKGLNFFFFIFYKASPHLKRMAKQIIFFKGFAAPQMGSEPYFFKKMELR